MLPTLDDCAASPMRGVEFKSYAEQYIDSLGAYSEAIIGILAAVAAQERIRISERTNTGLARVRARGTRFGRPVKTPRP